MWARAQAPGDCGAAPLRGANATSLKPWRMGAPRFHPMRVTDAVRRCRRQYRSVVPRAQATAALIGVTWLTTTTSPSGRRAPAPSVAKSSSQASADPHVHLGQRLPSLGAEVPVAAPLLPDRGRDPAQGLTLEFAVVDLDPALVHGDRQPERQEVGGVAGPAQRARAHLGHRRGQQRRRRRRLHAARRGELGVGPPEEESLCIGHRLAVAHQDQHRGARAAQTGTRIRPHCSQVATSPGGRARILSTSTDDSSRWQPSQWFLIRRAAPVPLRRARSVS